MPAMTWTTNDAMRPTSPPPRTVFGGVDGGRLLAPGNPLAFPTFVSGTPRGSVLRPIQWRGRTGIQPVSVSAVR